MSHREITKDPARFLVPPFLADYASQSSLPSWESIRHEFEGLPGGRGMNIAHEAVDRHARGALASKVALRWLGASGERRELTYADLSRESSRFANVLAGIGVLRGERVSVLTGRIPELYVAALGTWKLGAVFCPLFPAFGPEPIRQRLARGDVRVLVTTRRLYETKVTPVRSHLPDLQVLVVDDATSREETRSLPALMAQAAPSFEIPPTSPEDMALLHFTSGTTGMPKGAIHVHQAVLMHVATGKLVLDLHPDDVFWCTADPGWVTGTSYGIIAPLCLGVTSVIDEAEFDASRWYRILQDERVTVWYTAPTAIRRLMRLEVHPLAAYRLERLRLIHSVGEPLNPEAVIWGERELGLPIHDNWWQTETGGIMIANFASMPIRPGSMGRPIPGVEAAIVQRKDGGRVEVLTTAGVEGELALRPGWPSMFRGYLHEPERYSKCFVNGWYITGDRARRDEDGYYWFIGRADDIIKTAGHMVGPFEVESALMEHPAVVEAGVIGIPEATIGEMVKAFVLLRAGYQPTEALRSDLIGFGRKRLGSAIAPKQIEFRESLPRTRSGKIMRRLLKARELGMPEGDTSTLEEQ